jgi:hypothetical protein
MYDDGLALAMEALTCRNLIFKHILDAAGHL